MIVNWGPRAIADRNNAIAYVRLRNPKAAQDVLKRLIVASEGLAEFPRRGRPVDGDGTRELSVPPYILIYEIDTTFDEVTILRLWHAAQDR